MGQVAPAILAFSAVPATENLQVTHSKIDYRDRIPPSPPVIFLSRVARTLLGYRHRPRKTRSELGGRKPDGLSEWDFPRMRPTIESLVARQIMKPEALAVFGAGREGR